MQSPGIANLLFISGMEPKSLCNKSLGGPLIFFLRVSHHPLFKFFLSVKPNNHYCVIILHYHRTFYHPHKTNALM